MSILDFVFHTRFVDVVLDLARVPQDNLRDSLDDWTVFTAAIFKQHYPRAGDYAGI
jgi:hypothetical protein